MTTNTINFCPNSSNLAIQRGIRSHLTKSNCKLVKALDLGVVRGFSGEYFRKVQVTTIPIGNPELAKYKSV